MIDENLRVEDPDRYVEFHSRAAAYFEQRVPKAKGEEAERWVLEQLYHRIRAEEATGIQLFQEMAEEFVQYRWVTRLRALLNGIDSSKLRSFNNRLWHAYYHSRLVQLEGRMDEAARTYRLISDNPRVEPKLKAYSLCDLGDILRHREYLNQPGGVERAIAVIRASLQVYSALDQKLVLGYDSLSSVYTAIPDWDAAWTCIQQGIAYAAELKDKSGLVEFYREAKGYHHHRDDWHGFLNTQGRIEALTSELPSNSSLRTSALAHLAIALVWMGRYAEAENWTERELSNATDRGEVDLRGTLRDSGVALAKQGKFRIANDHFERVLRKPHEVSGFPEDPISTAFRGIGLLCEGRLGEAETYLVRSVRLRQQISLNPNEGLVHLGILRELQQDWTGAMACYSDHLARPQWGHHWFDCMAHTGVVRVKMAYDDYAGFHTSLKLADQLALAQEYNDHLASLRLTQGHVVWDGHVPEWGTGFGAALGYYQQALIYALRYNRFLLDEVLVGRPQGTPLRPIIPHCLERAVEGRRMLITLRDWWQTGVNDIGTPRPDTISPIPEGISLLEGERIAREREPGDGSLQTPVLDRIDKALQENGAGE